MPVSEGLTETMDEVKSSWCGCENTDTTHGTTEQPVLALISTRYGGQCVRNADGCDMWGREVERRWTHVGCM